MPRMVKVLIRDVAVPRCNSLLKPMIYSCQNVIKPHIIPYGNLIVALLRCLFQKQLLSFWACGRSARESTTEKRMATLRMLTLP